MYQVAAGSSFAAQVDGLEVINPWVSQAAGYPQVLLIDEDGDVVQSATALPGSPSTTFGATLTVPAGAAPPEGHDLVEWRVRWLFRDVAGNNWTFVEPLHVLSNETATVGTSVFVGFDEDSMSVVLPWTMGVGDTAAFHLYSRNEALGSATNATSLTNQGSNCLAIFPWTPMSTGAAQRLEPYDGFVRGTRNGVPYTVHRSVYYVTPSIMGSLTELDHMLNKARVQRIVPSLHYSPTDLMLYLNRGLHWFNSLPPNLTSFTGTNMQGGLRDFWLTLSHYYGLLAQLGAHIDLDFNMSGQSVTLQVDQRAGVEALMSTLRQEIDTSIIPFRRLLLKTGVTGGDGSGGNELGSRGNAIGHVQTGNHGMLNLDFTGRRRHTSWWPLGLVR